MRREIKIAFITEGRNTSMNMRHAIEMLQRTLIDKFPEGNVTLDILTPDEEEPNGWKIIDFPEVERGYRIWNPAHIGIGNIDEYGYLGVDLAMGGRDHSVESVYQKTDEGFIFIGEADRFKPSKEEYDLLVAAPETRARRHTIGMCGLDFGLMSKMKPMVEEMIKQQESVQLEYNDFMFPNYAVHYPEEPKRFHQVSFNRSDKFPKKQKFKTNKRHEKRQFGGRRQARNWQR